MTIIKRRALREKTSERISRAVAFMLPRPLVYWATIRLVTYGMSGIYEKEELSRVTIFDLLQRWRVGLNHRRSKNERTSVFSLFTFQVRQYRWLSVIVWLDFLTFLFALFMTIIGMFR